MKTKIPEAMIGDLGVVSKIPGLKYREILTYLDRLYVRFNSFPKVKSIPKYSPLCRALLQPNTRIYFFNTFFYYISFLLYFKFQKMYTMN